MTEPDAPLEKPISRKMEKFCEEFLIDLNRTRAAERAGYGPASAKQRGHLLMRDPRVLQRVNELMREREESTRVKAYKVLEELSVVAFSSIDHYAIDATGKVSATPDAPPGAMRAIASVKPRTLTTVDAAGVATTVFTSEIALWEKNSAITSALKHLGLLKDVVEHRDLTLEDIIREAASESTSDTTPDATARAS